MVRMRGLLPYLGLCNLSRAPTVEKLQPSAREGSPIHRFAFSTKQGDSDYDVPTSLSSTTPNARPSAGRAVAAYRAPGRADCQIESGKAGRTTPGGNERVDDAAGSRLEIYRQLLWQ